MNGEEFYKEFKRALDYLGLTWEEKEKVRINITAGFHIDFSYNGRSIHFFVGKLQPIKNIFETVEK